MADNSTRPILHSIMSSGALGMASMLANLILLPLAIRWFGSEHYGAWLLLSGVSMLMYQADLGMGAAVVRFGALQRGGGRSADLSKVISSALLWNAVVALVATVVYVPVASLVLARSLGSGVPDVERSSLVAVGAILVAALSVRPFSSLLQGAGLWALERGTQLCGVIAKVGGYLLVGLTTANIVHLAVAETVATVLPSFLAVFLMYRYRIAEVHPKFVSALNIKQQLSYSVRAFTVNSIGNFTVQSGTVIVGLVSGASAVTSWNAAFRVYSMIKQLSQWSIEPFMPRLTLLFLRDSASARRVYLGLTTLSVSLVCLGVPAVWYFVRPALDIWLRGQLDPDSLALPIQILVASVVLNAMHLPSIVALNASGHPGVYLPHHMAWFVMTVIAGLSLTRELGILGMAFAFAVPLVVLEPFYLHSAATRLAIPFGVVLKTALGRPLLVLACGCAPVAVSVIIFGLPQVCDLISLATVAASLLVALSSAYLLLFLNGGSDANHAIRQRA